MILRAVFDILQVALGRFAISSGEELSHRWSTGNVLFSSKADQCASLKIRSYADGIEGFPGYSLSVLEGTISDLEGVLIAPILALGYHYFVELLDIVKLAAAKAGNHIHVAMRAYEERQKVRSHPPRMYPCK